MAAEPFRDSVYIAAEPERIFEYFTRPEMIERWMGGRAALDPRPGGEFRLFISGVAVVGRYVEVDPPRRVVVTWGREGSSSLPAGASTLQVTLMPRGEGTVVEVVHDGLPDVEVDKHAIGWTHYLPRLAAAVTAGDAGPDPWETALPGAVLPSGIGRLPDALDRSCHAS